MTFHLSESAIETFAIRLFERLDINYCDYVNSGNNVSPVETHGRASLQHNASPHDIVFSDNIEYLTNTLSGFEPTHAARWCYESGRDESRPYGGMERGNAHSDVGAQFIAPDKEGDFQ